MMGSIGLGFVGWGWHGLAGAEGRGDGEGPLGAHSMIA